MNGVRKREKEREGGRKIFPGERSRRISPLFIVKMRTRIRKEKNEYRGRETGAKESPGTRSPHSFDTYRNDPTFS